MTEVQAANQKEEKAQHLRDMKKGKVDRMGGNSDTETEGTNNRRTEPSTSSQAKPLLKPEDAQGSARKRRSVGEVSSGEISTDSEWDKVDEMEYPPR